MASCRFCKGYDHEADLLKYGTRHYAHAKCFFEAGKSIDDLQEWQIRKVPYLILKQFGLLDHPRVKALTEKINAELAAEVA